MDLHKKIAHAALEGPLLDWVDMFGDDYPGLCDRVMGIIDHIDEERRDAAIQQEVDIALAMMRHPSAQDYMDGRE